MAGVPREHTDWMLRRFTGRTTRLLFDDYVSEPFDIVDGYDQGDPGSVLYYLFYNTPLARIDPNSGIYIDDYHGLAIRDTLLETTQKVQDLVTRQGGADKCVGESSRSSADSMRTSRNVPEYSPGVLTQPELSPGPP
ncbi:hypothetical protein B0H17DRAFT_956650 [Mycena rosella]|uniref:Uncharacterized protein n=1 Tax=Mycena rosella TaxID=1033263 RepID=A0AAD7CNI7_MYCRO|nr:hypothetical protein B0H17DRAFT_956650 [Mycena rosella]